MLYNVPMFRRSPLSYFTILILVLTSCGKSIPTLDGVDRENWIADPHGCKSVRATMVQSLEAEKDKLLALNEMQIVEVLGKPDENELYKRNQKFYYYQLTPSNQFCPAAPDSSAQQLVIRFNAMGLAKEVSIE